MINGITIIMAAWGLHLNGLQAAVINCDIYLKSWSPAPNAPLYAHTMVPFDYDPFEIDLASELAPPEYQNYNRRVVAAQNTEPRYVAWDRIGLFATQHFLAGDLLEFYNDVKLCAPLYFGSQTHMDTFQYTTEQADAIISNVIAHTTTPHFNQVSFDLCASGFPSMLDTLQDRGFGLQWTWEGVLNEHNERPLRTHGAKVMFSRLSMARTNPTPNMRLLQNHVMQLGDTVRSFVEPEFCERVTIKILRDVLVDEELFIDRNLPMKIL